MDKFIKKISLGSVQFGTNYGISNTKGKTSINELKRIISYASKNNIENIDTAAMYGSSEKNLGLVGVSNFKIVSKIPPIDDNLDNIQQFVIDNFMNSLKSLKMSSIRGVLLHDANNLLGVNGDRVYGALQFLKKSGLVSKIGISVYNPFQVEKVMENFDIDIVQGPVNIFDQRFISSGLISKLSLKGIEFESRSVFLQGLALMDNKHLPNYFLKWIGLFNSFKRILKELHINPVQACIAFSLALKDIERVVIGIEDLSQLKEILLASNIEIDTHIFQELSCEDEMLINPSLWP